MSVTMTQVEKLKSLRYNLPELVYPRGHRSRFTGVDALVQHPAAELLTANGNVTIARASGGESARLSLGFLRPSHYPTGMPVNPGDRIRLLTLNGWEDSLPDPFEHVAYGRAVEDIVEGRSRTFLQYWLFAPMVEGPFRHEGDINLIEIMLTPDLQAPEYVLITQHRGAEVRHRPGAEDRRRPRADLHLGPERAPVRPRGAGGRARAGGGTPATSPATSQESGRSSGRSRGPSGRCGRAGSGTSGRSAPVRSGTTR